VYEQQPAEDERPGCRDTLLLTRAVFGVILPPLMAMLGVLILVSLAVVFFAIHPLLAVLPVAALGLGIYGFARWEQGKFRPPGLDR
jgi:hypothetical protein